MDKEVWVDVPDYEGCYQVSDLGRVKSLDRLDSIGRKIKSQIIKPYSNNKGYLAVSLCKNAIVNKVQVHQLVAIAFLGHKRCGLDRVVDHINNICTDNRLENLQIISQRENVTRGQNKRKISSKYTGVRLRKSSNRWSSSITVNGVKRVLGTFDSEEEAAKYYQMALDSIERGEEIKDNKIKSSSIYKGVHYCNFTHKWRARIYMGGKNVSLGRFSTEYEAHLAYQKELKNKKRFNQ